MNQLINETRLDQIAYKTMIDQAIMFRERNINKCIKNRKIRITLLLKMRYTFYKKNEGKIYNIENIE